MKYNIISKYIYIYRQCICIHTYLYSLDNESFNGQSYPGFLGAFFPQNSSVPGLRQPSNVCLNILKLK